MKKYSLKILSIFSISFMFLFIGVNNSFKINSNNFISSNQLNKDANLSEKDIQENQSIDDLITDLNNLSPGSEYTLQKDYDFSNYTGSESVSFNGTAEEPITINGNGHVLYGRNIEDVYSTDTFVMNSSNINSFSFFSHISYVNLSNLTFDNFMFPFGTVNYSNFYNVNVINTSYENLKFDSSNYSIKLTEADTSGSFSESAIGLVVQNFISSNWSYSYFDNLDFSNNQIKTGSNGNAVVIAPIGLINGLDSNDVYKNDFSNFYVNDISYTNNIVTNSFSKESQLKNNDIVTYDNGQTQTNSVFYSPFIGSIVDDKEDGHFIDVNIDTIIINNINVNNNVNNSLNYTYYNIFPAIFTNSKFVAKNVYGFNLNLNVENEVSSGKLASGNIPQIVNYGGSTESSFSVNYSAIYQTDWLENANGLEPSINTSATYDSIVNDIKTNNSFSSEYWFFNQLDYGQDSSLVYIEHPQIIIDSIEQYDGEMSSIRADLIFRDGIYNSDSKYEVKLVDKTNNKVLDERSMNDNQNLVYKIDTEDIFKSDSDYYVVVEQDGNVWETQLKIEKIVPKVKNISSNVRNGKLSVTYEVEDSFNLINSINITLYDSKGNLLEQQNNSLENLNKSSGSFTTNFDTAITNNLDDYYIEFKVKYDINKWNTNDVFIENATLDNNFVNYGEADISFIVPKETLPLWAILLIVLIMLILILLIILLIILLLKKRKQVEETRIQYIEAAKEYGIQIYEQ